MSFRRWLSRSMPVAAVLAVAATAVGATKVAVKPSIVGRVRVSAIDPDTERALPFRAILEPLDDPKGTPVLADADGSTTIEVAPGRYRLTATRGLEYSLDRREITVQALEDASVEARLRRVVDTSTVAACDFHVHAKGSFDSRVPLDVRVRSLLAAGLDFAIPSEHNHVGRYPRVVGESHRVLAWAPGIEVTKRYGHFNVFPYDGRGLPSLRKRGDFPHILDVVRRESPTSFVQINHPRLGGMGYFNEANIDTRKLAGIAKLPPGFDLLEVYSGMQLKRPEKVEQVIGDYERILEDGRRVFATSGSDAHAAAPWMLGYPRTYVTVANKRDEPDVEAASADAILAGLRQGHAFVTSGPLVFVSQGDLGPGDVVRVGDDGTLTLHVKVAAAPWIDVTSLELHVGGQVVAERALAARNLEVGLPDGEIAALRAAAVRFDGELTGKVPRGSRAAIVVVRGRASMADAVPTLPFSPLAFSNPVFLSPPISKP